jgi:hypothetical protein
MITSGSGTSWTFSGASQGTIGSETMGTSQTWCTVGPTVWGGNVDMSGIYQTGAPVVGDLMNSYIANIAGNNCGP